jgi:hypothetical protein
MLHSNVGNIDRRWKNRLSKIWSRSYRGGLLERSRGNKRDLRRKRKVNWVKWKFPVADSTTQEHPGPDNIVQIRIGSILAFSRLFDRLADPDISKKSRNDDPRLRSQILMGESWIIDDLRLPLILRSFWWTAGSKWLQQARSSGSSRRTGHEMSPSIIKWFIRPWRGSVGHQGIH